MRRILISFFLLLLTLTLGGCSLVQLTVPWGFEDTSDTESEAVQQTKEDWQVQQPDSPMGQLQWQGGTILGLYSWENDLLVYSYDSGNYVFTLLDPKNGTVKAKTAPGFDYNVSVSFGASRPLFPKNNTPPQNSEADSWEERLFEFKERKQRFLLNDGIFSSFLVNADDEKQEAAAVWLRVYDIKNNQFIWMDKLLNVVDTFDMPEKTYTLPCMDFDNTYLYYVNASGDVIRMDMENGEDTLLQTGLTPHSAPSLDGLLYHGELLLMSGILENKTSDVLANDYAAIEFLQNYVHTKDNQVVSSTRNFSKVYGAKDSYFTLLYEGISQAVFGRYSDQNAVSELIFDDYSEYQYIYPFPDASCVITYKKVFTDSHMNGRLSLYSLESGQMTAGFTLPAKTDQGGLTEIPLFMTCFPESKMVVYITNSEAKTLYTWKTDDPLSHAQSTKVYKEKYMDKGFDDAATWEKLRAKAQAIGDTYDVEIYTGEDCPLQLIGYTADVMKNLRGIERSLMILEQCLKNYPEGFFTQIANEWQGKLKFYLTGQLHPDGPDSLESTLGIFSQTWNEQYIAVNIENIIEMETLIYHEISHAIDNKLFDASYQTYHSSQWDLFNPAGFQYEFSYKGNEQSLDVDFVYGMSAFKEVTTKAHFVDKYSKSFPTEDRARIMEYAMGHYPVLNCFEENYLKEKLEYISKDIRGRFDTTGWPKVTWWERALYE